MRLLVILAVFFGVLGGALYMARDLISLVL